MLFFIILSILFAILTVEENMSIPGSRITSVMQVLASLRVGGVCVPGWPGRQKRVWRVAAGRGQGVYRMTLGGAAPPTLP